MNRLKNFTINPPLVLAVVFASLILIGGIILTTPFVTVNGQSVGFINGLFTAASALCVTGLTVVNTGSHWNIWGHITIIILIQIGGLGVMTMATLVPMLLSKKIGLTSRKIIKEELNFDSNSGIILLLIYVMKIAFLVEAIGAIILAIRFIPEYGLQKGLWFSVFHSISAYCNAGFDLFGNSIMSYKNSVLVNFVIMTLIVTGGLGFQVIIEIFNKKKFKKLSTHSKLVLTMTGILIIGGAGIFWLLEMDNILANESYSGQLIQSLFQSVTNRTAGFNSVDISLLTDASVVLFITLMFIGGSPGSTAGGLKTTTFGVLWYSTIATIRGEDPVIFGREIPKAVILKSLALVTLSILLIIGLSFILTITEVSSFLDILFEVTSAYGTVGLTRGITPELSNISKLIITLTMYLGRLGPLTFGYAIGHKVKKTKLKYPKANITVG